MYATPRYAARSKIFAIRTNHGAGGELVNRISTKANRVLNAWTERFDHAEYRVENVDGLAKSTQNTIVTIIGNVVIVDCKMTCKACSILGHRCSGYPAPAPAFRHRNA
jgi:hypothetical protein